MSSLLSMVENVFLPSKCLICGCVISTNSGLCSECEKNVAVPNFSKCLLCGLSECECRNYFRYMLAPFYYEGGIDTAIRNLKFKDGLSNSQKLAFYMAECVKKYGLQYNFDVIIAAPLYAKDEQLRGYNQSFKLAFHIGKLLDKPVLDNVLIKIKDTQKQHELPAAQRFKNLVGAFDVLAENEPLIKSKKVLLVDDVFTTGTTMNRCSKALINAGSGDIIALAAAKTRYERH